MDILTQGQPVERKNIAQQRSGPLFQNMAQRVLVSWVLPAELLLLRACMLSQAAVFILQFDAQVFQMLFRKPKQALRILWGEKRRLDLVVPLAGNVFSFFAPD